MPVLMKKRQAYWVCTLIDESEVLEAQAAEAIWRFNESVADA